MANVAVSWSGSITHITDDPEADEIKTRCGRTLKNFSIGHWGSKDCQRCGSEEDFDQIHQAYLIEKERREAAHQEQEARKVKRLETHRRLMGQFEAMLKELDAEIVEHRKQVAGGSIEFRVGGLKFKLSGNIW